VPGSGKAPVRRDDSFLATCADMKSAFEELLEFADFHCHDCQPHWRVPTRGVIVN
jgi:hypothetical protein